MVLHSASARGVAATSRKPPRGSIFQKGLRLANGESKNSLLRIEIMVLPLLSLTLTLAAASLPGGPATVLIAPGVHMPRLNLGTCCGSDPTVGVKAWFAAGGTGIDTAWDYKDQPAIAAQLRASGKKRGAYFLTTKVPAGIGALEGNRTDCDNSGNLTQLALDYVRANVLQLGVDQVDLVRGVPRRLASTRRLPLLI